MLAASKAKVAWWKVGAIESLALLLLSRWLSIFVTFIVRACLVVAVIIAIVHVYVLRIARLVRVHRTVRVLAGHADAVTMFRRARVVGGKLESSSGWRARSRLLGGDFFIGLIGEARTESRRHG